MNSTLIRKIAMECPLCDTIHEVEERTRLTTVLVKGIEVEYRERYFFCSNSDEEECEFETGSMCNENLAAARKAYQEKVLN